MFECGERCRKCVGVGECKRGGGARKCEEKCRKVC